MTIHTITPSGANIERCRYHNLCWIGYFPGLDATDSTKGFKLVRDTSTDHWCVIEFLLSDWHQRSSWNVKAYIRQHGWARLTELAWLRVWYPDQLVKIADDEVPTQPGLYITSNYVGVRPDRILYLTRDEDMTELPAVSHVAIAKKALRFAKQLGITLGHTDDINVFVATLDVLIKNSTYSQVLTSTDALYAVEGQPRHVDGNPEHIWLFYLTVWLKLEYLTRTRTNFKFDIEKFILAVAQYHDDGRFLLLGEILDLCRKDTVIVGKLCTIMNAKGGNDVETAN